MTNHRLCRAHFYGLHWHQKLFLPLLSQIIMMCSCSMCINIIYFLWFIPASSMAGSIAFSTTSIFCRRSNMERIPVRTISNEFSKVFAPRFFACSNSSKTTTAGTFSDYKATSCLIKWSLRNGSLSPESAVRFVNPATATGVILLSVPPKQASHPHLRTESHEGHLQLGYFCCWAVTTSVHFPLHPRSIATFPAAILDIIKGISIRHSL